MWTEARCAIDALGAVEVPFLHQRWLVMRFIACAVPILLICLLLPLVAESQGTGREQELDEVRRLITVGELTRAEALLRDLTKRAPNSVETYFLLGTLHSQKA